MEIMGTYNGGIMVPYSPSPKLPPIPDFGMKELDEWISNQFGCKEFVDCGERVPTLTLLNSLCPLMPLNNNSIPTQDMISFGSYSEDQILEHCRVTFFHTLNGHFEEQSVGGPSSFLPGELIKQAILNGSKQSTGRCEALCLKYRYDESSANRVAARLNNFVKVARVKIEERNRSNCAHYLEWNRMKLLTSFCDELKQEYKYLYQPPNVEKTGSHFPYDCTIMTSCFNSMISRVVVRWKEIKNIAKADSQGDYNSSNDDMAAALTTYINELRSAIDKHNKDCMDEAIAKRFDECKTTIENLVKSGKYLGVMTLDRINKHVTKDWDNFRREKEGADLNVIQEKVIESLTYGRYLFLREMVKNGEALHLEAVAQVSLRLGRLQRKYRLKRVRNEYEPHVLGALEVAKTHFNPVINVDGTINLEGERNGERSGERGGVERLSREETASSSRGPLPGPSSSASPNLESQFNGHMNGSPVDASVTSPYQPRQHAQPRDHPQTRQSSRGRPRGRGKN